MSAGYGTQIVFYLNVFLLTGVALRHFFKRLSSFVPYTVLLMLIGVLLGVAARPVVSLVLETRERLLAPPASEPNEDAIDAVLAELEEEPRRGLRRFEIVWSPAEEGDRMSTAELERVYGELEPLPAGASLGRHRCAHCRAPYAAELGACPACGAPR